MPHVQNSIATSAATLGEAQSRNFLRWDILNVKVWPNPQVAGSYQGEVDYFQTWLNTRTDWLSLNFPAQ